MGETAGDHRHDLAAARGREQLKRDFSRPAVTSRDDLRLADPKGFIPGNKMAFAGVKKPEQRADILAYLRQMHPEPPPFPQ